MNGTKYALIPMIILGCVITPWESGAAENLDPPVTYHLSFEDYGFLEDDIAAKYKEPSLERRNLKLVPGQFGKALFNANVFRREDLEKTSMSTWDLDPLLKVLVHRRFGHWKDYEIGRMEPYIWGTGRLKGESGCVAFRAKGKRVYPGYLFFQGSSSFGRMEQYLIAIELMEDGSLEAYVRDARYRYHRIASKPVWTTDTFHHVALVWDRAQGLSLYVDGELAASNTGSDAWWGTQTPGLFHMPMCGFTYDELWMFDRALTAKEIGRLMRDNTPPVDSDFPAPPDGEAVNRLKKAFIGDETGIARLPVVGAFDGETRAVFREVFPEYAGDGCVSAHFVLDGKYELAWPQDYTSFTNILGDSDFHPEKVDIRLPEGSTVNYITIEGNLSDAKMLAGDSPREENMKELLSVPGGKQLFFGAEIEPLSCEWYRIPFLKEYGSPPGYEAGLNLPLTGDIRIHEVGFYNITNERLPNAGKQLKRLYVSNTGTAPTDGRCGYAFRAGSDRGNSRVLALSEKASGRPSRLSPGPFTRINCISEPWVRAETIQSVAVDLDIGDAAADDFVILRLHDPGIPARIWNTLVFRLGDFRGGKGRLSLELDCADIKAAPGDRLWIDIAFSGSETVRTGGEASTVTVYTAPLADSDGRYAEKALKPARSDFTKLYYWYYPWTAMREVPDADNPPTFGGFYDIVTYPLIVTRTEPDDFTANAMLELSLIPFYEEDTNIVSKSRDNSPDLWPPVKTAPNDGSPEWAFYMHYYLSRYKEIVDWWAEHQNYDGQVGGGWNDDVLFASRLPGVFLYSGDKKARGIFNRIFEGLERTRMFHDGYCNIVPMDYLHVEDLVRNRYEGLLFEPGDARKMTIAMRTARWYGKPEETPVNYIDGKSFKLDNDLVHWYWGEAPDYPAYSETRDAVTAKMKEIAPSMDEVIQFRYTEAGMFTDGSFMPGCYDIKRIQIGDGWDPWTVMMALAVSWEEGGGPEIPKWVESATDTSFVAHLYSYDTIDRDVTARLYRLKRGVYRVTLAYEGEDADHGVAVDRTERMTRFSTVTVPVRPAREFALSVRLVEPLPQPGPLPDIAVSDAAISDKEGAGDTVTAVVYNFGATKAENISVRLLDAAGQTLAERTVETLGSAADFVPKQEKVLFPLPEGEYARLTVTADPDDDIDEIYEENNTVTITISNTDTGR